MKPRIWMKQSVERDGSVLGDGDINTILPGDFTLPVHDNSDSEKLEVKLESLELTATSDPPGRTPTPAYNDEEDLEVRKVTNCSAAMKFIVVSGEHNVELTLNLRYDVHFVTAHPCVPSQHTALLKSPTSPSFRIPTPPPYSDDSTPGPRNLFAGKRFGVVYGQY
jgi:hypothetical protein